jgi:hypothetical protein
MGRWVWYVECMRKMRNSYKVLVKNLMERDYLGERDIYAC